MIRKFFSLITKHLGIILIAAGCVLIAAAVSTKLYTRYEQSKLIDDYRSRISVVQGESSSAGSSGLPSTAAASSAVSTPSSQQSSQKYGDNLIGILSIPRINLEVGIGKDVSAQTLKYAVGHFPKTAMPGEKGNFCVAGHRSYTFGEFFNRLDEVQKGDPIFVESGNSTFKYLVTEIKVVTPKKVSVLEKSSGREITLVTCTPVRSDAYRLIVKGVMA